MGTLRLPMLAAAILAAHPAGSTTAQARQACVTITVFVAAQPMPSGPHCQIVPDDVPEDCHSPHVMQLGYGARLDLCLQ
jgi:hypothetical protein